MSQSASGPVKAVRRIDAIFDVEGAINGLPPEQRLAVHPQHVASLVAELETWMRTSRGKLSRHNDVAKVRVPAHRER